MTHSRLLIFAASMSFAILVQAAPSVFNPAAENTLNLAKEKGLVLKGVVLESSRFSDVTKVFGINEPRQEGDAGMSGWSNCYTSKGSAIEFRSSSEMAGGAIVSSIQLVDKTEKPTFKKCKTSKVDLAKAKLDNGLGLGSTKEEITKVLGAPKDPAATDKLEYTFERKIEGGSESLSVTVKLGAKGQATSIEISKLSST